MSQLSCLISAGEFSGDLLAAELVRDIRLTEPRQIQFFGITGPAMQKAGVETLVAMDAFSVMGFLDVLAKILALKKLVRQILAEVDRRQVKVAILVDYPGFHFYLAKELKARGVKVVQYAAPKLWAWGEKRAANLRRDFAMVLGFFPFEIDFFAKHAVPYQYVGNPHLDRTEKVKLLPLVAKIKKKRQAVIGIVPGSRPSEIRMLMPILCRLIDKLVKDGLDATFVIPVALNLTKKSVMGKIPAEFRHLQDKMYFVKGRSLEVMKSCDLCLVTSGTATLECALLNTPMIVLYKMDRLTYLIAKRRVKITWISLVNILLGRKVVSEYVQDIDPSLVAEEVLALLPDGEPRRQMLAAFSELRASLRFTQKVDAAKEITNLLSEVSV